MVYAVPEDGNLHRAAAGAAQYLAQCGIADAAVDAWILLEFVTGITRADYLADYKKNMTQEQGDVYALLVNQRGSHIPLQYLTGEQAFMGLSFRVSEDVLIPRQDTETLSEAALEKLFSQIRNQAGTARFALCGGEHPAGAGRYRVLDLCTGSGCIAVSMLSLWDEWQKKEKQGDAVPTVEIVAADLSEEALAVARENADHLLQQPLRERVQFLQSDLFENIRRPAGADSAENAFDLIVSNPPYICTEVIRELPEEVRLHEPELALNGGADGLDFYRRIIPESRLYLRSGGWLFLEIGFDQGEAVSGMLKRNGFSEVKIKKDLSGNDRVASGQWA